MITFKGSFDNEELQVDCHEFTVEKARSIHFHLHDTAFEHALCIVKDANSNIRAVLSFKTRLFDYVVSEDFETTSNLCFFGPLPDGVWTITIIKPYQIKGSYSVDVDFNQDLVKQEGRSLYELDFSKVYNNESRWYQGDFHAHTSYSDGRIPHSVLQKKAMELNLDFVTISEHSTQTTKFPELDALIVPSTEITLDDFGHYNIHGLKKQIDYPKYFQEASNKSEVVASILKEYSKDHIVSMNHPFPRGWDMKHEYDVRDLTHMEVINAPHLFNKEVNNERAVKFFDFMWSEGHYLYGIGGSDAHKKNYFDDYPLAIPMSKVYVEELSIQNLMSAVHKGHLYLEVQDSFEVIAHEEEDEKAIVLPGDRFDGRLSIGARTKSAVYWQLIKNGVTIEEKYSRFFQSIVDVKEDEFYRLQATNQDHEIIFFMNPIHNMKKVATENSFQALLKKFKSSEKLAK